VNIPANSGGFEIAVSDFRAGNVDSALSRLIALIEQSPNDVRLRETLAEWSRHSTDRKLREEALRGWVSTDGSAAGLQALRELISHLKSENTLEARTEATSLSEVLREYRGQHLRKAKDGHPEDLLRVYVALNETREALNLLDQQGHGFYQNLSLQSLSKAVQILAQSGRHAQLVDLVESDLPFFSRAPVVYSFYGASLISLGHYQEAQKVFAELIADAGPAPYFFDRWLEALRRDGKSAERAKVLHHWEQTFPGAPTMLRHKLAFHSEQKDWPSAVAAARQVLSLGPQILARDYSQAVSTLINAGHSVEATEALVQGCTAFPDNTSLSRMAADNAFGSHSEDVARRLLLADVTRNEVGGKILSAMGEQNLLNEGGAGLFFDKLTAMGPDAEDGLLDIAEVFLKTARRLRRLKAGEPRESQALHAYGAADWKSAAPRVESLCVRARILVLSALSEGAGLENCLKLILEADALADHQFLDAKRLSALYESGQIAEFPHLTQPMLQAAMRIQHEDLIFKLLPAAGLPTSSVELRKAIAGLDEKQVGGQIELLSPRQPAEVPVRVFGPTFTGEVSLNIECDSSYLLHPTQARVLDGYLVELRNGRLLNCWEDEDGFRRSDVFLHRGPSIALIDAPMQTETIKEPAIFVSATPAHYRHYFHFFGQMLPRIVSLKSKLDAGSKLMVPSFTSKFVFDLLGLCGITQDMIQDLPEDRQMCFENLLVTEPLKHNWQASPQVMNQMRSLVRKPNAKNGKRRIYLMRKNATTQMRGRALTNQDELAEILSNLGFEMLDPGGLSISEQRDLFADCAVLCAPTGAGLSNIHFLPDNADVICLSPHETCRNYYPGQLIGSKMRFTWVLGSQLKEGQASGRFPHIPYHIDPNQLRAALKSIGIEQKVRKGSQILSGLSLRRSKPGNQ
jgi:tetratricopeptide (TPR) repeat protein